MMIEERRTPAKADRVNKMAKLDVQIAIYDKIFKVSFAMLLILAVVFILTLFIEIGITTIVVLLCSILVVFVINRLADYRLDKLRQLKEEMRRAMSSTQVKEYRAILKMKLKMIKKNILIVLGVIVMLVVAFLICWKATEHDRYIEREKNKVLQEISRPDIFFFLRIDSLALQDPNFIDFLVEQAYNMFENDEPNYDYIRWFLGSLEFSGAYINEIQDAFTNLSKRENIDLEDAFKLKEQFNDLHYYTIDLNFNRDSTLVAAYVEFNGIEKITTTPGTGFYADKENEYSRRTIGLPNSPLYEVREILYKGDFMVSKGHGRELKLHTDAGYGNGYYEEEDYSYTHYAFRDNSIDFNFNDGECIYSGDYLFCFASDGALINYAKIKKK